MAVLRKSCREELSEYRDAPHTAQVIDTYMRLFKAQLACDCGTGPIHRVWDCTPT